MKSGTPTTTPPPNCSQPASLTTQAPLSCPRTSRERGDPLSVGLVAPCIQRDGLEELLLNVKKRTAPGGTARSLTYRRGTPTLGGVSAPPSAEITIRPSFSLRADAKAYICSCMESGCLGSYDAKKPSASEWGLPRTVCRDSMALYERPAWGGEPGFRRVFIRAPTLRVLLLAAQPAPLLSPRCGLQAHRRAARLRLRDPRLLRAGVRHPGEARAAHRATTPIHHNAELYKQDGRARLARASPSRRSTAAPAAPCSTPASSWRRPRAAWPRSAATRPP